MCETGRKCRISIDATEPQTHLCSLKMTNFNVKLESAESEHIVANGANLTAANRANHC